MVQVVSIVSPFKEINMLGREKHIEQINRFHDKMKQISQLIEGCGDREDLKSYKGELALQYFRLSEIEKEIDDLIEFKIKDPLDSMESD